MSKFAVAGITMVTLTVVGGFALAGIEGSKHDFSNAEWADGDPCAACHGVKSEDLPTIAPLWDPDADLTRRFNTPAKDPTLPGYGTRVCLRCHDGSLASNTIGGIDIPQTFANKQNEALFSAGHQTSDHPVGVEYPQFDKGYRPLISVAASNAVTLPDGKVECTSCHDPHNEAGAKHMLVTGNVRSALCLICHKK